MDGNKTNPEPQPQTAAVGVLLAEAAARAAQAARWPSVERLARQLLHVAVGEQSRHSKAPEVQNETG